MKKNFWIVLFISFNAFSQKDLGTWNIVNFNLKINSKWNSFVESQLRSLSFYDQFHYYEYKGGVTYKLTPSFSATTGIGSYNTYSEGGNFELPTQNREVRTWLQFNLKNDLKFVTIEHRYRSEQRFTSQGYKNRFRYRLSCTLPVNNVKIIPKTFYILTWNELFFTDNEPYFERNRLFIGGGYEFSNKVAIQTGFIHQFDYKINDETGRNFLNIALLYSLDLTNKNDFTPTIHD